MLELAAYAIALLLTGACAAAHCLVMRRLYGAAAAKRRNALVLLGGALLATHVGQICLFGIVYFLLSGTAFGFVKDAGALADFVYFSFSVYTTLGIGDLYPVGPLRAIAGVEGLIGLVLIAWSASLALLQMQRQWDAGDGDR